MKNLYCLLVYAIVLLFGSCEEDPCEGLILDVITQQIFVEYVNEAGENLLTNGTYLADEITISFNGFSQKPFVFDDSFNDVPEELQNRVQLDVISLNDKPNIWTINLNSIETDSLELFLSVESSGCSGTFYTIDDLKYNNTSLNYREFNNANIYLITVVK